MLLQEREYYHKTLLSSPEAQDARDYLESRGIDRAFIQHFNIGYCPLHETPERLNDPLFRQMLGRYNLLDESGELFFKGRITFELYDTAYQLVGFTARRFRPEQAGGKYITSKEGNGFCKANIFGGFLQGFTNPYLVLVEGIIDALHLHTLGIPALAILGNSLSTEQCKVLQELTGEIADDKGIGPSRIVKNPLIVIAFDGDLAGEKGATQVFQQIQGFAKPSIIQLPDGHDPDSLIRHIGRAQFKKWAHQFGAVVALSQYTPQTTQQAEQITLEPRCYAGDIF